jgi:hypothetical protein
MYAHLSMPSDESQHLEDLHRDQSQALVAEAQRALEASALHAVEALTSIARYGEDGPRVKAATEILDRIGVGRRSLESSVSFPPEMLAGVLAGMASMFGQRVASEALQRTARDITPARSSGLHGKLKAQLTTSLEADPHKVEAPKRKRGLKHGGGSSSKASPLNAPVMALTGKLQQEDEE